MDRLFSTQKWRCFADKRGAPMGQVGILQGVKNDVFLDKDLFPYRCNL